MGQILKENLKSLIVESAINDLYENGVTGASMRKIAKDANMTVGNLYRYFTNKDELVNYIIEPVIHKISLVLLKNTNQSLDLKNSEFDIHNMAYDDFIKTFDDISKELCHLYSEHKKVFIIVLKSQTINDLFLNWCVDVIYRYMCYRLKDISISDEKMKQLSRMYAVSLFAGIIDLFLNNNLSIHELEDVLKIYFRTSISLVNLDFKSLEV